MNEYIQLKKDNILKIGIKDSNGNETGEHLEFDLEDIDLPLRINQCDIEHRKNLSWLRSQLLIIDKKQNIKVKKSKNILNSKDMEKIYAIKEFCKRETAALELFIGKDGVKKFLNGRKAYYSMYEDISEMLEPIMPLLNKSIDDITDKIKKKYSLKKEENVLE